MTVVNADSFHSLGQLSVENLLQLLFSNHNQNNESISLKL